MVIWSLHIIFDGAGDTPCRLFVLYLKASASEFRVL